MGSATARDDSGRFTIAPQTHIRRALYEGNKADKTLPVPALNGLLAGDLPPWRRMSDLPGTAVNKNTQKAEFFIGNINADDPSTFGFYINDKSCDPGRIDYTRQVGTIGERVLTSKVEPHIFHIHVNPFQVLDVLYAPQGETPISIFGPNGECLMPPNGADLQN